MRAVQNGRQRRDRLIDSCDFIDNLRMAENTILAETIRPFVNEINNARSAVNKGHPNLGPQFFGPPRTRGAERGRLESRPHGLSGSRSLHDIAHALGDILEPALHMPGVWTDGIDVEP